MREILFRGKRIDNGEWVEGTLYQISTDLNPFIMLTNRNAESHEVDPATLGQFTGLTDKNGERIFEGDILEFRAGRSHTVKFDDGCFIFTDTAIPVRFANKFEVIGNIHDNPELLEDTNA